MDASTFFDTLFGACESENWCASIWSLDTKASRSFAIGDTEGMATYALQEADRTDVYVGVCPFREAPASGRGTIEMVAAVPHVWVDIDVANTSRGDGKRLPPSFAAAMSILDRVGLAPSMVIDSGHGLHAYWCLSEPFVITSEEARMAARKLTRRWWMTVREVAKAVGGWDVDPAHDLARVLRVPDTWNRKGAKPVRVAVVRPMRSEQVVRYHLDQIENLLIEDVGSESGIGTVTVEMVMPRAVREKPARVAALIEMDARFRRTWNRQRLDLTDQSPSGYDMAIADHMVMAGAQDQEIADAISCWRHEHQARPEKALRRSYIQGTIRTARAKMKSEMAPLRVGDEIERVVTSGALPPNAGELVAEAARATEMAADEPEGVGASEGSRKARKAEIDALAATVAETTAGIGEALGIPLTRIERLGDDRVSYVFHVKGVAPVTIGGVDAILNPKIFLKRIIETLNTVPNMPKKTSAWAKLATGIFRCAIPIEVPESARSYEILDYLIEYFADGAPVYRGEQWNAGVRTGEPFIRDDGKAGFALRSFLRFVRTRHGERFEPGMVYGYLRTLGFEQGKISIRIGEQETSRSYWTGPANTVEPAPPPVEETAEARGLW